MCIYRLEGNFREFGNLLRIRQTFTHQLLLASDIAIEAGLKFAKVSLYMVGTCKYIICVSVCMCMSLVVQGRCGILGSYVLHSLGLDSPPAGY